MRLLVHLTVGVENPTKVSLALLVAATAVSQGHDVDVFVAGDGVAVLRPESLGAINGIGTGAAAEHLQKLRATGARLFASKMSAAARGISEEMLREQGFAAAPPTQLVELIASADRVVVY